VAGVSHPPVLIGGIRERPTLRLVAQYGDAWNLFDIPDGGGPCGTSWPSSDATARRSAARTARSKGR
jgi:alkanesulfonate monooxygenase SsuD/methylene tetrahydromethanopterin reductase-like flavin-dependent oxidoreductase (luciferase family)